jgi:hypothetical protein
MTSSSNGASSFHNNGMQSEVVVSKPTKCMCKLPIKKMMCLAMLDDNGLFCFCREGIENITNGYSRLR